jgi:hypothetical protein
MWVFMKDAFLSIVEHEAEPRLLHIRGRVRGDIEKIFPEADVVETIEGDYRFRTSLPRERVAQAVALRLSKINYTNFKNSVADMDRKQAYIDVWSAMYDEQHRLYGVPPTDADMVEPKPPRYVLEDPRFDMEVPSEEPQTVVILEQAEAPEILETT